MNSASVVLKATVFVFDEFHAIMDPFHNRAYLSVTSNGCVTQSMHFRSVSFRTLCSIFVSKLQVSLISFKCIYNVL